MYNQVLRKIDICFLKRRWDFYLILCVSKQIMYIKKAQIEIGCVHRHIHRLRDFDNSGINKINALKERKQHI